MEQLKSWAVALSFLLLVLSSCQNDYTPKPRGYYRIDLPEKSYRQYDEDCPYTFEYPVYGRVVPDSSSQAKPCWIDVAFPEFNGRIHLSYHPVTSREVFNELIEDTRKLAFKHTVKATAIDEATIRFPQHHVYGVYYTIAGNTASSVQFFLTDSTRNYLRGALYFHEQPRQDSIQPVLDFIKKDIDVMIRSFKWKNR
ncbi:MAG TPA: gliding motility lipoprotein GldD [Sphingobacteriaceae bacterium]